jgi:hypothetical protein
MAAAINTDAINPIGSAITGGLGAVNGIVKTGLEYALGKQQIQSQNYQAGLNQTVQLAELGWQSQQGLDTTNAGIVSALQNKYANKKGLFDSGNPFQSNNTLPVLAAVAGVVLIIAFIVFKK